MEKNGIANLGTVEGQNLTYVVIHELVTMKYDVFRDSYDFCYC